MEIKASVEAKQKRGNQLFFSRDSECLQPLIHLVGEQTHRALVMWALDCAQQTLQDFEAQCPCEPRPRRALDVSEQWARGMLKMPVARRAILDAHAVAKELDDREAIALVHAIGHAGATVHAETHALGLVFYELTALVHRLGLAACPPAIERKIYYYTDRLRYWQEHTDALGLAWAAFLLNDARPNKEKLLYQQKSAAGRPPG